MKNINFISEKYDEIIKLLKVSEEERKLLVTENKNLKAKVLTSSPCDSLYLYPTCLLEIEDEISKLDCSKATGPFSTSVKIFKAIKKKVSGPLEIIFNASLLTGIVPRKLKVTKVIPVFKTGSRSCINN